MNDDECTCAEYNETHTCPYAEDVHNDSESRCTCCSTCEHECAMDI